MNIEDDEDEVDWARMVDDSLWGMDGFDTALCQSALSPDGLFRSVGRTSSSALYAFERFRALCRYWSEVQLEIVYLETYRGLETLELAVRFRPWET